MEEQTIQETTQPKASAATRFLNVCRANKNSILVVVAAVVLVLLAACWMLISGISDSIAAKAAYNNAESAFENIDEAYNLTNAFSHDVYQAWFEGINHKDKIKGETKSYYSSSYDYLAGLQYLVEKMDITFEEVKKGVVYACYGEEKYAEMTTITDEDAETAYKTLLTLYDSEFSACVNIVTATYEVTGKAEQIDRLLVGAKADMKKMSEKYADYVHYPDLKDYLTLTRSFYDFCVNPEGSFEQVVQTFNDYRNNSRNYYFALDYIFQ